jgi:hypothetical protein
MEPLRSKTNSKFEGKSDDISYVFAQPLARISSGFTASGVRMPASPVGGSMTPPSGAGATLIWPPTGNITLIGASNAQACVKPRRALNPLTSARDHVTTALAH